MTPDDTKALLAHDCPWQESVKEYRPINPEPCFRCSSWGGSACCKDENTETLEYFPKSRLSAELRMTEDSPEIDRIKREVQVRVARRAAEGEPSTWCDDDLATLLRHLAARSVGKDDKK